jgi:hypothetical protein
LYCFAKSWAFLADHWPAAVPCVAEALILLNNAFRMPGFV